VTDLSQRRSVSPNVVLVIVCAGVVLASLDLFIVNVARPSMAKSFGETGLGDLSWVLNAYAIVFGALLIPAGRAADRFGRKGVFMFGAALFTAASAACAVSPTLWALVAFRCVQAAGAAILVPSSLGLALLAGAAFTVVNRRSAMPVIDLALFRDRMFSGANLAMVLGAVALAMQLLGLSLFLQQSWHWSPLATGAAIAPAPLATFAAAKVTPRLLPRLHPATMAAIGFVVIAAGQVLVSLSLGGSHSHDYAIAILPGWIVSGIGGGLAVPTITGLATIDLPPDASATGSAVLQMARQLGSVLGTSVLVAILGTAVATGTATVFLRAWWVCVACYVAAAGVAAWLGRR
jgi:MFS family permease